MDDALYLFQEACRHFQDETAKQFLSEFPKHPEALSVTRRILEFPSTNETQLLQFQAAIALRQTLILHWTQYSEEQKNKLQSFVVQNILKTPSVEENIVRGVLCGIAAIIMKLRGPDHSTATEFMEGTMHLIKSSSELVSKYSAVCMLQAVVEEFDASTATPLGLSVDVHAQCAKHFQKQYLLPCFVECIRLSETMVQMDAISEMTGAAVCYGCCRAMNAILSWDFHQNHRLGPKKATNYELRPGSVHVSIQPETNWTDFLADERLLSWISPLLLPSSQKNAFVSNNTFLEEAQRVLIHLCSIRADTFPTNTTGSEQKQKFLKLVLSHILPLLPQNAFALTDKDSIVLAASSLDALSQSFKCSEILSISKEILQSCSLLDALAFVTKSLLDSGSMSPLMEDTPEQECCQKLLSIWRRLCTPEVYQIYKSVSDIHRTEGVKEHAGNLFRHILSSELRLASLHANAEDDLSSEDSPIMTYAVIGQASYQESFPLLSQHLKSAKQSFIEILQKGQVVPPEELEKIAFLVELTGCMIADEVEGEEPSIPIQLSEDTSNPSSTEAHAILRLSLDLIDFSMLLSETQMLRHLSTRVVKCILLALSRWAETYLIPSNLASPSLEEVFGDNPQGRRFVHQLCAVANTCLISFPAEADLQEVICCRLLKILTRSNEIRQQTVLDSVIASSAWLDLMEAFSKIHPVFHRMPHKMVRYLACALCSVSDAMDDVSDINGYLKQLLSRTGVCIHSIAEMGGTAMEAEFLVEILRGVTRAAETSSRLRSILFTSFTELLQPLLVFLNRFDGNENIVCSILKLSGEMVAEEEAAMLLQWALQLIRSFSDRRRGKQSIEPSDLLQKEKEHEQGKDIRALLLLLKNVTDRELASNSSEIDIANVVLEGMERTIPLMTTEMLKFPKLCFQYFDLLSHICEMYPEKIVGLPHSSLETLLSTIIFGLNLPETKALRIVLESLEHLAKHQWEQQIDGKPIIPNSVIHGDDSFASYFGKLLLQRLLTRDEEGDAIAACSGVLVYFFACERERIRELLVSTLERYCRMQDLDFDLNALLMHERQNPCDRSVQDAFRETLYRFINKARQLTRLH